MAVHGRHNAGDTRAYALVLCLNCLLLLTCASLDREVTPVVVWFYINTLFFPYNAQDLAKIPFEEFSKPILENLRQIEDTTSNPAVPSEKQQA